MNFITLYVYQAVLKSEINIESKNNFDDYVLILAFIINCTPIKLSKLFYDRYQNND